MTDLQCTVGEDVDRERSPREHASDDVVGVRAVVTEPERAMVKAWLRSIARSRLIVDVPLKDAAPPSKIPALLWTVYEVG